MTQQFLKLPYDFKSVMHYREYDFTIDGSKTIEPRNKYKANSPLRNEVGMTDQDAKEVDALYGCISATSQGTVA